MAARLPTVSCVRWLVAAGVAVAVLAAAGSATGRPDRAAPAQLLRMGGVPLQLLAARGTLWLLTCDRGCSGVAKRSMGRVIEIDPRTGTVIASVKLARPGAIAVGPSGVYATDFWRNRVRRLDPRTLRSSATLHLKLPRPIVTSTYRSTAFAPEAVAVGDGSVWVATARGALARTDPLLRRLTGMLRLPFDTFEGIATAPGTVWLGEGLLGLYRVSSRTNRLVARIRLGPAGDRLVVGEIIPAWKRVLALGEWTSRGTLTDRNGLARIDPTRNRVQGITALPVGQLVAAYGGGSLWVGRVEGRLLERIDPAGGSVIQRLRARVGIALSFAHGHVWTVSRDGTLRQLASA